MRWIQMRLQSWLDLEPDELKPTALCFAITFTWGFSQMLGWTAANTLFLQHYDSSELPLISIAAAVLIPLSGMAFLQLNRRLTYRSQFLLFASLFVAAPLVFWMLMTQQGWAGASLGYSIWYYLEIAFAALLMDSLLNRMFNLRQAKRVFGPISTGSDMAGVPAGLCVGLIVGLTGVENLLLFSAAISSIVLLLFLYVARVYRARMVSAIDAEPDDGEQTSAPAIPILALLRHPLVLCILAIEALNEFNLEFINNAFYSKTEQFLSQPEEMAAFLGIFFAIASVFSSIIQLLASSRLMRLIGVAGCLIAGPILVAIMLAVFVGGDALGFAPALLFASMAAAKFVQYTVLVNVNDVAQFTLVRSLPLQLQDRVLALSGTVLAPVLGGLSGLALLGLIHLLDADAVGISCVVLVMLMLVILFGLRAAREYRRNLAQVLNDRAITGIELPLNDPETARRLLALVRDPDPQTALCSLEILSRQSHGGLKTVLSEALRHPDAHVRRRAASLYQTAGMKDVLPILRAALDGETDAATVAELLPALARAGQDMSRDTLLGHLHSDEARIAAGACVGLVRFCGTAGLDAVRPMLEARATAPRATDRIFVADTLGRIGHSPLDALIVPLLRDADFSVRRSAVEAAGRLLQHPELGAALLDNLDDDRLRPAVIRALVAGADSMLPTIDPLLDEPARPVAVKRAILRIFGRVRTDSGISLLRKRLGNIDPTLQRDVVRALEQSHYRPQDEDRAILESLVQQFCAAATWLLACKMEVSTHRNNELLERALEYELHKLKDQLLLVLGFLYSAESMNYIRYAYFYSHSEDKIAAAVELLDNLLQSRHRDVLLPILEGTSLDRRVESLQKKYPLQDGGMVMRLVEIMNGQYGKPSPWLQAVTLNFAAHSLALRGVEQICSDDEVLQTTTQWLKPSAPLPGTQIEGLSVIDKVAALKRASIFAEVPDEILAEYAPATVERHVAAGAGIIRQGDSGSTLCLIVDGRVRVHVAGRTLVELGAGEVFGELAALDPEPRSANVDALAATRLLEIDAATVDRMISERGEAAQGIIRVLCQRIQATIRAQSFEDTGSFQVLAASLTVDADATGFSVLTDVEKAVLLKTVDIFHSLPDDVLMHLASLAREQHLEAGRTLIKQGEFGTSMYVIVDGEVAVHAEDKVIATLRRGKIIGELALLTSEERSSTISALHATRLLKISQTALNELMWDHPAVTRSLIRVLAARLRAMITRQPGNQETPP